MDAHFGPAPYQGEQRLVQVVACYRVGHPLRLAVGLYPDILTPGMERARHHWDRYFPYGFADPEPVERPYPARINREVYGAFGGGLLEGRALVIEIDAKTTAGQRLRRQAPDRSGSYDDGPFLGWVSHGS